MAVITRATGASSTATPSGGRPYLQGGDGVRIELTPELYDVVRAYVLDRMDGGHAKKVTTGEAARVLGVSRRTMARMLDRGVIPCSRMSERGYRFLDMDDVLAYKRQRDAATSAALDDMRSSAMSTGGYDVDYTDYLKEFDD